MISFSEMLKGNQHKIDKNKNGKVDAHDFKLLRKMKKEEAELENQETVDEQAPVAPTLVKHKINVTVSDPNHTMVSKRNEKMQKTVIVTHSDNKEGAQKVGEKFYKKKGYRVHDSIHAGMVKEEVEQIDEMDKSQPSSSRGAEGLPLGKKAEPVKTDKVKSDALKVLQKQYKKVKEEVEIEEGMKQTLRKYVPGYAKRELDKKMDAQAYAPGDSTKKTVDKDVNYGRYKKIADKLKKEETELDEVAKATGDLKDACWKGYTAVGMKMKNGKKVPNCVPVKEEEELEERNKENAIKRKMMDASRGAQYNRTSGLNIQPGDTGHQTKQQMNKALGRALRKEDLEEKMDMSKADMGDVIKDFQKSDAPQFAGKSKEKRRQMAIAAKLQADRMKKEGVEMKSYKQFMEDLYDRLPEQNEIDEEVEQIDELDMNLLKSMQKHAKANPRPKSSSDDAIDPKTGRLKPYGYRGKSEYEKSETGDDDEPKKRGRKTGVSVGSYKRRQPK